MNETGDVVEVVKPGLLTTLQDLGRVGYQRFGVPVTGAMDACSHRVANLLVGNAEDAATLEITWMGPSLRFLRSAVIAIAGADLSPRVGDEALPQDAPLWIGEGSRVDFGRRVSGTRAYLAIRGGFDAAPVMESRSTYLRGKFGGFDGRALRKGDLLGVASGAVDRIAPASSSSSSSLWPSGQPSRDDEPFVVLPGSPRPASLSLPIGPASCLRLIEGQQWRAFTEEARRALCGTEFRLSPQSDRMGFRFDGPSLALREPLEMISEAVAFGTMQVPPDGHPIVLMADRQTTGGYPKIAGVASVDLPILAQLAPGEGLRFEMIPLDEAQRLDSERERAFDDFENQLRTSRRN